MTKRALRRILLVEDDPDIQEVTTLLLSHIEGFDVAGCRSAVEALETAQTFNPDLILLDVMMPGLDGQGAFAAFRRMESTVDTPVIFITARVRPREILEYRELGSLGVIPKPFDPDTLADTIRGMWERHQSARLKEARTEDLAALRAVYAADLPERLRAIERSAADLESRGWDPRIAASLFEMTHRLAGSASIYGFPAISEAALQLGASIGEKQEPQTLDPKHLRALVANLSRAIHQATSTDAPPVVTALKGRPTSGGFGARER